MILTASRRDILNKNNEWDLDVRRQRTHVESFLRVFLDKCRTENHTQPQPSEANIQSPVVLGDITHDQVGAREDSTEAAKDSLEMILDEMVKLCQTLFVDESGSTPAENTRRSTRIKNKGKARSAAAINRKRRPAAGKGKARTNVEDKECLPTIKSTLEEL
jgi:hypothetical protein